MISFYNITIFVFSFFISSMICLILIYTSEKTGWIEKIKQDRWHNRKVAKFGGVAIFSGTIIPILLYSKTTELSLILLVLGSIAFLLGLYDDIFGLFPSLKMLIFIIFAILCFNFDIILLNAYPIYISMPITILWIVGIINALNIIDNMDGLSSGIASIILISFTYISFMQNNTMIFLISTSLLGACLGFLIFNFNPAKIFMGDSGSLFIGLLLSVISLKVVGNETNVFATLLVPTLLLVIPIFDTTLVTINRIINKTPVSRGGVDHTSHRLVSLGISEKNVVLLLYFISISFCFIAVFFSNHGIRTWVLISVLTLLGLGITGLFLSYYSNNEPRLLTPNNKLNYLSRTIVQYKKQILEVLFDALIIIFSFSFSHYLRYENNIPDDIWKTHDNVIGWMVVIKISIFYFFNLYKGVWKYASVSDIINAFKASFIASLFIVVFIVFIYGDSSFSRSIFFLDFILTFIFISFVRVFYRIFSELILQNQLNNNDQRVLILGAGQLCQLILRKIYDNESDLKLNPIGILDNKLSLKGRMILGVKVLGEIKDFQDVIIKNEINLVLIAKNDFSRNKLDSFCLKNGVDVRQIDLII